MKFLLLRAWGQIDSWTLSGPSLKIPGHETSDVVWICSLKYVKLFGQSFQLSVSDGGCK